MTRWLFVPLVVAQLALVAFLARPEIGASEPTVPVRPTTAPAEPLSIESAIPLAEPVARAWRADAVLISAAMRVEWPRDAASPAPATEAPESGLVTLVYASADRSLSLLIDRPSGVIFESVEEEWTGGLTQPLPVQAIQRSSTVALLAAEVSYGSTYRMGCPDLRHEVSVHLVTPASNPNPVWRVIYRDDRYRDQPDIVVSVDVVTGNVIAGQAINLICFPD